MTFSESLDLARLRTINAIRLDVADKSRSGKVHIEPLMRTSDGMPAIDPCGLRLPLRWDYYLEGDTENHSSDSTPLVLSVPLTEVPSLGLQLNLHSLCWDCMRFHISPSSGYDEFVWLSKWAFKWLDIEDEKVKASNGLYEVIHFVSDPVTINEVVVFVVDFGSSPTEAFVDLLHCLKNAGVSKCEVGVPLLNGSQ